MFIRVFDPKGFRIPYTEREWRKTETVTGKKGSIEDRRMPRAYYPYTTPTEYPPPPPQPKGQKKKTKKETKDSYPHPSESTIEKQKAPEGPDVIGAPGETEIYTVADCMTSKVVCFLVDKDLKECMKLFNKHPHNYFPVINDDKRVVGIISDRELMSHATKKIIEMKKKFGKVEIPKLSEIMTSPVVCVEPQSALYEAARFMVDESLSAMPVINENEEIVGIVTRSDILRFCVKNGFIPAQ